MAENLLRKTWAKLESHELRLLLDARIGGPGQFDGRDANPNKFYLPSARASCRVALTFRDKKIIAVERGPAFDAVEWQKIADEIENASVVGPPKVGRGYSFSSFRVPGSWCGLRSGVQILPPAPEAPQAPVEMAAHPFILEFPIVGAPDDLWPITNYRRMREHRRLTLLLNVLLTARVSFEPRRSEHFWAHIPASEATGGNGESRWLQQFFWAPLGAPVTDALSPSPPAAERLATHLVYCEQCHGDRSHEVPGATERFRSFFETYAPGAALRKRRSQMYELRSGILHGSTLMQMDEDLDFGWDPPGWNERELHTELWSITRLALRNWLKNPPGS